MSVQALLIGEMLRMLRLWQALKDVFTSYALTAAFVDELGRVAELLARVEDALNQKPERPNLKAADDNVDTPLRRVSRALDWLEETYPEEAALWSRLRLHLFPKGLKAVVSSSYRNEAGELERMGIRLEETEGLRADLDGVKMHKRSLLSFVEEALAAGKVLAELVDPPAAPEPAEGVAEPELGERQARGDFIALVGALRKMVDLAKWTQAHRDQVFNPLEVAVAEAEKRARATRPAPSVSAAPA